MDNAPLFMQPIRRSNVVDDIIERFKQALIDGEFQPGQRLPSEPELGETLGVGRSTIREAIKILSALGAVEVRRGDGTYVSSGVNVNVIDPLLIAMLVEPSSAGDLYELRHLIEVGYSKLAAAKADGEDFERLHAAIDEMEQYVSAGGADPETLARLDLGFHQAILDATKNPLVAKVGTLVNTMFVESLKEANSTPEGIEWTLARHRILLGVLQQRDPAAVEQAIGASLAGWKRTIGK